MKLEMFFDCASPYSYLCFERLIPIADQYGITIEWRPVLVGAIFNLVNPGIEYFKSKDKLPPRKLDYIGKDMRDWAELTGVKLTFPPAGHPVNSVKAGRACHVLAPLGKLVPFARACFQAYFGDQRPISDDAVLLDISRQVGIDSDWLLAQIARQDVKDALRATVDEAVSRGVFGVPTIFLNRDDMYFGVDRLQLVEARLASSRGSSVRSGAGADG